MREENLYKDID